MGTKRVLMIVGDFVEDYEAMVPFQALGMVGLPVDAVCPGKTAGDTVATAIHDFEGQQTYSEKRGHAFALTADFAAARAQDYAALVIPGGRAPEYLRLDARVLDLVRAFHAEGKPIAAICHGAQVLAAAGVIAGRTISAYAACRPDVELAGGIYADLPLTEAVTDGNLITGPVWTAHSAWLAQLLKALGVEIRL